LGTVALVIAKGGTKDAVAVADTAGFATL